MPPKKDSPPSEKKTLRKKRTKKKQKTLSETILEGEPEDGSLSSPEEGRRRKQSDGSQKPPKENVATLPKIIPASGSTTPPVARKKASTLQRKNTTFGLRTSTEMNVEEKLTVVLKDFVREIARHHFHWNFLKAKQTASFSGDPKDQASDSKTVEECIEKIRDIIITAYPGLSKDVLDFYLNEARVFFSISEATEASGHHYKQTLMNVCMLEMEKLAKVKLSNVLQDLNNNENIGQVIGLALKTFSCLPRPVMNLHLAYLKIKTGLNLEEIDDITIGDIQRQESKLLAFVTKYAIRLNNQDKETLIRTIRKEYPYGYANFDFIKGFREALREAPTLFDAQRVMILALYRQMGAYNDMYLSFISSGLANEKFKKFTKNSEGEWILQETEKVPMSFIDLHRESTEFTKQLEQLEKAYRSVYIQTTNADLEESLGLKPRKYLVSKEKITKEEDHAKKEHRKSIQITPTRPRSKSWHNSISHSSGDDAKKISIPK